MQSKEEDRRCMGKLIENDTITEQSAEVSLNPCQTDRYLLSTKRSSEVFELT